MKCSAKNWSEQDDVDDLGDGVSSCDRCLPWPLSLRFEDTARKLRARLPLADYNLKITQNSQFHDEIYKISICTVKIFPQTNQPARQKKRVL
jgi:hypothetical protein